MACLSLTTANRAIPCFNSQLHETYKEFEAMKHLLISIALLALSFGAFAHPASELQASYTASTQTLKLSFEHSVKNPLDHYIQSIEIRHNGTMIISQVASAQDTASGGEYIYKIPNLKKNDKIDITLICNKSGRKTASMVLK